MFACCEIFNKEKNIKKIKYSQSKISKTHVIIFNWDSFFFLKLWPFNKFLSVWTGINAFTAYSIRFS